MLTAIKAPAKRTLAKWAPVQRYTMRLYSKKSLLDEGMLEQAGMDVKNDQQQQDKKKRWENTARKRQEDTSTFRRQTRRGNIFTACLAVAALGFVAYEARPFEESEHQQFLKNHANKQAPDVSGWGPAQTWARLHARLTSSLTYFEEPAFEKLLPDPLAPPYGRPLTLVLALEDLLVKSEWTRQYGWRTAKRPGVDYFLGYLAQYYEVVLWSDKYSMFDEENVLKLDPYRASISYSLFREATRFKSGKIIKDINHLNRDVSKVIMVDVSKDAVSLQPDNALVLPKWKGNKDDTDLVRLIPLLEWIGAQQVKDVRPVLRSYQGKDVLDEFEHRETVARAKWQENRKKQAAGGSSFLSGGILGMASRQQDLMPQDIIRQEGQKGYAKFQQYLEEYGAKMLEEEKKREKEIMDEHKITINKWLTGGGPTPEELAVTMARKESEAKKE